MSGSGKSTLAIALEHRLREAGRLTKLLDGDNIRSGLNQNLGFSDEDRAENIRRIAEVAKLFAQAGVITLASFITPQAAHRAEVSRILGPEDCHHIYVKASFEACAERDVKGLYAKAAAGGVAQFTGKDSAFEEPLAPDLVIETETETEEVSLEKLFAFVWPRVQSRA